ncbi:hypothetical protein ZWY2020_016325 [Hordeum vulgare]|nr:hypothetical protein ZWY2020_016325 [Hordeum vulgare]
MAAASSVPRAHRSLAVPPADRRSPPSSEATRAIDRGSATLPRHRVYSPGVTPATYPPETEELHRLGLLVPPGCRLAQPWRISKDGYPTKGDSPTAEELRTHRGGRYNARGRHAFWYGKSYYAVVAQLRPRRWAAIPQPPPAAPPVLEEFDLPPEQIVLREDGVPDDTPGLLVALRASQAAATAAAAAEAAREEAEIAAAIQAAQAMGAADPQSVVGDDDDVGRQTHRRLTAAARRSGVGQDVVHVDESDYFF